MRAKAFVTNRIREIEAELKRPAFGKLVTDSMRRAMEEELRQLKLELANIEDRARETISAENRQAEADARRTEKEEIDFWFRRFFTTLGIANGAAFAALASGLLQSDNPAALAPAVGPAMDKFIWGALAAGSIPFGLWLRLLMESWQRRFGNDTPEYRAWWWISLVARQAVFIGATVSVLCFCWGLFIAAGSVHGLAEGKKVADARVAAESKARVHAPPPVRE